jgi:hypothetical protein
MWDTMISSFASVARGYVQGHLEKASADTNNRINEANAANGNKVRGASNAFAAAKGALARYMQSVSNNNRLAAGGEALEANLVNARRREDVLQGAGFEAQVRNTEQMGAQAAAAAFAGVGGGVADMVSASTRLMQQRASRQALTATDQRLYDTSRRAYAIQSQTVRGLDSSMILDSLDYTFEVAQKEHAVNPWMRAIIAGGDAWIDGKGFYDDKNNRTGTTQRGSQQDFRRSELNAQRGDSYEPDTRDYSGVDYGGETFSWGTGSDYGNDDYGNYI